MVTEKFRAVTIAYQQQMCYTVMDYTPGGVYFAIFRISEETQYFIAGFGFKIFRTDVSAYFLPHWRSGGGNGFSEEQGRAFSNIEKVRFVGL